MARKRWFTADLHLGHTDIIKHCQRPFSSIDEHDDTLIDNWNECISENDLVYILGDFAFRNHADYLSRLKGNKYFINGSHDIMNVAAREHFVTISELKSIHCWGRFFELCHYPLRCWERSWRGSIMLFGHSHGRVKTYNLSFDVGVDTNNYRPYSLRQIMDMVSEREKEMRSCNRIVTGADGKARYYQDDIKYLEFLLRKSEGGTKLN